MRRVGPRPGTPAGETGYVLGEDIGRDVFNRQSFGPDGHHVRRLEAAVHQLTCPSALRVVSVEPCPNCLRRRGVVLGGFVGTRFGVLGAGLRVR